MPQGGPLSLLLSNILLDELDKELERRGHSFCRYADDCNIYVSSRKAGDHLLKNIRAFVENKLKLKVNEKKSAVARPWERKFLGYSVTWHKQAKLKIALTSVNRLKEKVRSLTTGNRSKSVKVTINALTPVLRGWISYFRLTGSQRSAGRAGRLDQTETAVPVVAAVEEAGNSDEEPAKSGAE